MIKFLGDSGIKLGFSFLVRPICFSFNHSFEVVEMFLI